MLEAVSLFIICLVTHILDCYIFSKLINEKFKVNLKNVTIILVIIIIDYIMGIRYSGLLKSIFTNIITFILLKICYNKSSAKTLIGTLLIYLGYAVAEILFAIIFILILKFNPNYFVHNMGMLIVNIFIFSIYFTLFKISTIKKISNKIINWYDEKIIINIIFRIIIVLFLFYTIIYSSTFNKIDNKYDLFLLSFLFVIIIFVLGYFDEKSNNNQLTIKYDNLLDYVKDYETEVVEKGKAIHEHKNQLAVIDDMIPKSNKKLKKYISEKLDKISELDDNVWLEKLTNLPTGGTKGLVYFKIKKMLDNNISIYVEVDDELKNKTKWKNVSSNLEDYTRILGVYLDNAIEASIESKDKQIIIEFIDNKDNIEFILSNTYKGRINVEKIDKETYSTKGKGRGYGLSLVKDIVEKNKLISQSREINGKFYVQKLCIKK